MLGALRTLLELMRGQRLRYAGAILAMGVSTLLMYLSPLIVGASIDRVLQRREGQVPELAAPLVRWLGHGPSLSRELLLAGAAVVAVTLLGGLFIYLRARWVAIASESIARNLRNHLYRHLQHLPASYFDKAQTGDLVQRCTSDVDTLRLFYREQVVEIARALILLITVIPIMLALDWRMALVAVCVMPVIVAFAVVFFRRVQRRFKATDEAEGAMTTVLQENLTGIRVVRAFARQDHEIQRFDEKSAGYRALHWDLFFIMAFYWSSSDFLCFTQGAVVLFGGAWRVAHGQMTVGTLVEFLSYSQMYIWPVRQMGRVLTELGKAMVSLGRVQEILRTPEEAEPAADASLPDPVRGDIRLRHVSFKHGEKTVLDDVSLSIPAGKTLALLGPSGSGKSTLVHLLLRLYDYSQGSITLDGRDLKDLPRKLVRAQFGVVMQEPFLYSKSLRDNLKLGRHDAPDDQMLDAAGAAAIHDSIQAFDKQYDTLVGERGVTLSGGQRQRVAIARALLRDAPVLILDDALSAVDTDTETAILDALKRRRGRHTTLLIAHRLSTLMHADQIAVLDQGRVVQLGTHDELSRQPGLYRRLWEIQGLLEEDLSREMAAPAHEPLPDGNGAARKAAEEV